MKAVVEMIDRVTGPAGRASLAVNRFANTTQAASRRISPMGRAVGFVGRMFGGFAALGAVYELGRQFIQFDHAITSASAKFPGLNRNTEAGIRTIEQLRMTARRVGAQTEFSAAQAAGGLEFLAMAGFTAQQSMSLLPGVANLATVANIDFARSADIASDSLAAFGLMTKDTEQLALNFTRVQDVMAATVSATNTNLEDLFEAVKMGGGAFNTAGQDIEVFNAIAGRMAANTFKGGLAGRAMRAGIARLASPTAAATRVLDDLSISVSDSQGNMRNMIDILGDIETATQGMGNQQRLATLKTIFGMNAFSAYASIINEGVDQTRALEQQLRGATGESARMAAVMRTSLLNQLKALLSAVIELGFRFINAFTEDGSDAISTLTTVARALGPVFGFIGWVLSKVSKVLPYVIAGFIAYKVAIIALKIAQLAILAVGWIQYLVMMYPLILTVTGTTNLWTLAQWALNTAFAAFPLVWIIAAIIAIVAAGIWLYRNWDMVKEKMTGAWNTIKDVFLDNINEIKMNFFDFVYVISTIFFGLIDSMLLGIATIGGALGINVSRLNEMRTEIGEFQADIQSRSHFASPESQAAAQEGRNTQGTIDINVNDRNNAATVQQGGNLPQGTTLNLGSVQ